MYAILIWHQAGGRNNNKVFYLWSDKNEVAFVFDSKEAAKKRWNEVGMSEIHAGSLIKLTPSERDWI